MKNRFNEVVFAVESYHWQNTLDEARELMWADISKVLNILLKNDYITVVRDDDTDIIVIEFEHDEHKDAWGTVNPRWITDDELFQIECSNTEDEEEIQGESFND